MYNIDGYSLWCDFVERDFLDSEFKELVKDDIVNGATSNPAIFANSFKSSPAYKTDIEALKAEGKSPKEIYENLAIFDIKKSADILKPLYDAGNDGFISIEVDPTLCDDTEGTKAEGERLYNTIGMPNVMIKVPATEAGYDAMEYFISKGINVNATLIFSPAQAKKCAQAMKRGYEKTDKEPKAVISVFVSRFDRMLDAKLKEHNLAGKFGILNSIMCEYAIAEVGAKNVRTLVASTGVKGDEYSPSYYVEELLLQNIVNTAPLDTIKSFVKSDNKAETTPATKEEIEKFYTDVKNLGIDIDEVYATLLNDGLKAFVDSFNDLLDTLK
jgi:transaldolase